MDKGGGIVHEVRYKMKKLNSLALFVGTAECNGRCKHCAGVPLRQYAPKEDGVINEALIYRTVRKCYDKGARYLSISSSGEPTLSPLAVTKVFELLRGMENEGVKFSSIHLYSNGIRIGEDEAFCKEYLPLWKDYGLDTLYVTVHSIDEKKNAKVYGIEKYPSLELVVSRIHDAGLYMRANLVLSKNTIGTSEEFISTIKYLSNLGVDKVSAWPIRNMDDKVDTGLSPPTEELDKIEEWIKNHTEYSARLLRENSRIVYQTGQKLTLFPNGKLSNTWCNR
jgi:MoaA/NifB/PqqE/SkfB family radical SAM enzyme